MSHTINKGSRSRECLLKPFWSMYDQSRKLVATVDGRYVGFLTKSVRAWKIPRSLTEPISLMTVVEVELMSRKPAIKLALELLDLPARNMRVLRRLSVWEQLRPVVSAYISFAKDDMSADLVTFRKLSEDAVDRFISHVTFFRTKHNDLPLGFWAGGSGCLERTVRQWQSDIASE